MVRIIIETEEVVTMRSQEEAATSPQEPTVPAPTDQPTPPTEVLAAAAAIGAQDAGPAPVAAGATFGAPSLPLAAPGAPVAGSDDLAAGPAPGTPPEPPPTVITEDGE